MAGKPNNMSQIKQLLQLHQNGMKIKAIVRNIGISKNTVKAYLLKVQEAGWDINELLSLDDPILEARFHAGNPAYSDARFQHLKDKIDYYCDQLKNKIVTKGLLWEEYRKVHPDGYSHSQFCFHLLQHINAKNPTMVLDHKPGDKLFIDFAGKTISYIDQSTGEIVQNQLFVACLPYSGYSFIIAVPSQKIPDFIHAINMCLQFLGGVPSVIVPDNLKSAVTKVNKYEPDVNKALEDLANHYGTTILPTRTYKPKDKALVENQVRLTYAHVYARLRHQQFFSLHDLNAALQEKNLLLNQTRMQKKPYSREEKFLADEKSTLKPLAEKSFEIKHYKEYQVGKNNHVLLGEDHHYYSVPYTYIGQKAKVIYTRSIVNIYCKGKLIATHQRSYSKAVYSTIKDHLCSHHQHYMDRSPDYYIQKASSLSDKLRELFVKIFSQINKHPEQLYRTCDGLLNMARKEDDKNKFNKACQLALDNGVYNYMFILNIMKNNTVDIENNIQKTRPLPSHSNIRGKEYFNQLTINYN